MCVACDTAERAAGIMQDFKNKISQGAGREIEVEAQQLSADTIFEALSNSRRREIVKCLWDREEAITTSELVDEVAAAENDVDVQSLQYEQRKRVYTSLHQSHLPKLVEDGFVERDNDEVELTEAAERLKAHIELESGNESGSCVESWIRSRWPF